MIYEAKFKIKTCYIFQLYFKTSGGDRQKFQAVGGIKSIPPGDENSLTSGGDRPNQ